MKQVFEQEKNWINYTKEDVINIIDCSDSIYEMLVEEVSKDILRIMMPNNNNMTEIKSEV